MEGQAGERFRGRQKIPPVGYAAGSSMEIPAAAANRPCQQKPREAPILPVPHKRASDPQAIRRGVFGTCDPAGKPARRGHCPSRGRRHDAILTRRVAVVAVELEDLVDLGAVQDLVLEERFGNLVKCLEVPA